MNMTLVKCGGYKLSSLGGKFITETDRKHSCSLSDI